MEGAESPAQSGGSPQARVNPLFLGGHYAENL